MSEPLSSLQPFSILLANGLEENYLSPQLKAILKRLAPHLLTGDGTPLLLSLESIKVTMMEKSPQEEITLQYNPTGDPEDWKTVPQEVSLDGILKYQYTPAKAQKLVETARQRATQIRTVRVISRGAKLKSDRLKRKTKLLKAKLKSRSRTRQPGSSQS